MPGKLWSLFYHDIVSTKFVMRTIKAKSKGSGSDRRNSCGSSRKGRNLIEAALQIPGKITSDTGTIEKGS
jgi:hypothetical protein